MHNENTENTIQENDLPYTLLKRNEVVALYVIGGTYTDEKIQGDTYSIQQLTQPELYCRHIDFK